MERGASLCHPSMTNARLWNHFYWELIGYGSYCLRGVLNNAVVMSYWVRARKTCQTFSSQHHSSPILPYSDAALAKSQVFLNFRQNLSSSPFGRIITLQQTHKKKIFLNSLEKLKLFWLIFLY